PRILTYSPYNGQGGLPLNTRVEVLFDEVIDAARIANTVAVRACSGPTPPAGTLALTPDGKGLLYTFNAPLAPNSCYYLDVGAGSAAPIYDLAGNPLLNPFSWYWFSTGTDVADTTAPTVTTVNPRDGGIDFALNGVIQLRFSEPVSPTSISNQSIVVSAGGVPLLAEFGFADGNRTVTVKPANLIKWSASTTYDLQVTNNVRDAAGNPVTPFASVFTTGTADDTTKPTVVSITPANATVIDPSQPVTFTVTFSEPINPITLTGATFNNVGVNRAVVNYNGGDVSLSPTFSLSADQKVLTVTTQDVPTDASRYVALNLTNGISDVAGNGLNSNCVPCRVLNAAYTAPADPNQLFTGATVTMNPGSLPAYGTATTRVTVSGINRNNALVPNGTKVAVTVAPIYHGGSAGGQIIEGTPNTNDARFKVFTTLGGAISFNYQTPDLPNLSAGATASGVIQVVSLDGLDRPIWSVNNTGVTLYRDKNASVSSNPRNLLANGTSYAEVIVTVLDNAGQPVPAGTRVGVSAGGVYAVNSLGGSLSGGNLIGLSTADPRIQIHETGPYGSLNLVYTAPLLAANQSGNAVVEVFDLDASGRAVALFGSANIGLNGSSGATLPQPYVTAIVPFNGQGNVGRNTKVTVYFSKPLDPATVTTSTVQTPYNGYANTRVLGDGPAGPNTVLTI
ncbi:MAG: Ig-like domain-containing protein, partial [Mycolicibacterium neoaurum]|nr:Ig-like domain-containing protein [Mycolicibacterium neoaurum]